MDQDFQELIRQVVAGNQQAAGQPVIGKYRRSGRTIGACQGNLRRAISIVEQAL